jgi:gliding motility-associated-like protein
MDTAQTTITILELPVVTAGPDVTICKTTSTTLSASGAASYVWSPATGLSCTTCVNPVATPVANTTYVLTGTGLNGCVNTDTVNVNLYDQPPVNAGPDQTICAGQEAQLQASGANSYFWTPTNTLSCITCANPKAAPPKNTTYFVVGTDMHGCVDSDMVNITVIQRLPVSVGPGGEVCAGGYVQLSASGGDNYNWYPATGLSCTNCASPTANPSETTTYHVAIRQGQCFADTLSVDVVIHPIPTINAGEDKSVILGTPVQINTTATNTQTYTWTPSDGLSCTDCANPMAAPARDMTYVVTATSSFGCTATDEVNVRVRCDNSQIWLPNTFTPNADGQNDRFYPHGKGIQTIAHFRIYNRWGELIFDRTNMPVNDKSYGWDGTFKSQPLKPDVFVWIMDAECTNGEHTQTKGDISLIR